MKNSVKQSLGIVKENIDRIAKRNPSLLSSLREEYKNGFSYDKKEDYITSFRKDNLENKDFLNFPNNKEIENYILNKINSL